MACVPVVRQSSAVGDPEAKNWGIHETQGSESERGLVEAGRELRKGWVRDLDRNPLSELVMRM